MLTMTPEIKATIVEALKINRVLLTTSAAWDEHRGQQVVAINDALAWLQQQDAPQPDSAQAMAAGVQPNGNGLLPCPHCGEAEYIELTPTRNGMERVYCDNCGCSGYETDDREAAVGTWNQRPATALDGAGE